MILIIADKGCKYHVLQAYIPISLVGIFKGEHLVLKSLSVGEDIIIDSFGELASLLSDG